MSFKTPAVPASFHGPTTINVSSRSILPTHHNSAHQKADPQKRRKCLSNTLLALLIILLLYLLSSTIYLTVRVTTRHPTRVDPLLQECVSQFAINAPANPSTYPCSTCLPIVTAANDPDDAYVNLKQFCALTAVHNLVANTTTLSSWATDLHVCTWQGVTCDSSGRVTSLSLSAPGIPTSVPGGINALEHLQKLEIIGDNKSPAGAFPVPSRSAMPIQTFNVESTALTSLDIRSFSPHSLTTLSLVSNPSMDAGVTSTFIQNVTESGTLLQNLIINRQNLSVNPLPLLANSKMASSLVLIDLTSTSLPATLSPASFSTASFTSLKELHLDGNGFTTSQLPTFASGVAVTV